MEKQGCTLIEVETREMKNEEVERGYTNNTFEKFCYIGSGGWRKDVRLREGTFIFIF